MRLVAGLVAGLVGGFAVLLAACPSPSSSRPPAPAVAIAKAKARLNPFDQVGKRSVLCERKPANANVQCNPRREIVWAESDHGSAPEVPLSATEVIRHALPGPDEPALTIAIDGDETLWFEQLECTTCQTVQRRLLVAWLPGLGPAQRAELSRRLRVVGAHPLKTAAQWRHALGDFTPAGFDKLGTTCDDDDSFTHENRTSLLCGESGRVVAAVLFKPGDVAVPLRAEPLFERRTADSIERIAVEDNRLWASVQGSQRNLLVAIQRDASGEAGVKRVARVVSAAFGGPRRSAGREVWRNALR